MSTEYSMLCHGLMDAYLTRYAIYHYGNQAPDQVKAWVVAALGTELYVGLRPGAWTGVAEALAAEGTPAEPALSATAVSMRGNAPCWSPYMLLRAMRGQGLSKEQIGRLCESAVAGNNTQQALELAIQPNDPNLEPRSVPEWWADSTHALWTARGALRIAGCVARMAAQFMDFTVYRESGAAMENLRALWQRKMSRSCEHWQPPQVDPRVWAGNPAATMPRSLGDAV